MIRGVLSFVILLFLMGNVLGVEGVVPGSYEVNFEPGMERDFDFDFVLNYKADLRVLGDLSEYVTLDKETIIGSESVVAKLKLPEKIESFGVNNIWILAGDVAAIIKINVPYPEHYVELSLSVPDSNVGEDVSVNLKVSNFGKEGVNVSPVVDVYFNEEVVSVFEGEEMFIEASGSGEYAFSLDSANFSGGNYLAIARVVSEGEVFEARDYFRLGTFDVRISDYTREVWGGRVGKFNIEVESLYGNDIGDVYAEIRALDQTIEFEGFDTSVVSLPGWGSEVMVGYIDARRLNGDIPLIITLHYDDEEKSMNVTLRIGDRFNFVFWTIAFLAFVLVAFFVWKFFKKSK